MEIWPTEEKIAMATNAEMIRFALDWIKENIRSSQEVNWTVAVTATPAMIISKVGGVTSKTQGMNSLGQAIENEGWYSTLRGGVYLAQVFTVDANSNHAEMCILAATDSLKQKVADMECASPNCEACAHMLRFAGVKTPKPPTEKAQSGWLHPRAPLALGTQINLDWEDQIKELDSFNKATEKEKENFKYVYTKHLTSKPQGKWEKIL
ncbi:hypothetical protein [Kitasatospora griseola]|uniref:hypothetical protein n=1 Tax=Kitasatospora griseola TaxID=2064 RepID=UPI00381ED032